MKYLDHIRMEYAGALYHVTSRGDRQEDSYEEDADRRLFLSVLGDVCLSYNWFSNMTFS
ncbi:hypothetical protein H4J58_17345 [Colwellia sp. MB3u-70]|uniref:hypothetical protein n=1 Tax=unclassified Colwellia TaxID=196834 RepID=UPI0015F675D0|nr:MULTISPECIES: hypothetical protein [unclassified Colwellia]MBA6293693.1 hypothetical protein [Colwellia sp. MB3u-8]MBA6308880.1 hypothetical protein [Colwellia sp. MB3u-70]